MKKDLFNGNIKQEFVAYIWTTIILVIFVAFGCGGLFLYFSFIGDLDSTTSDLLLVFGIVSFLYGFWHSFGTLFVIRKYPKHRKLIKWFLNSEHYFVGGNSKTFYGNRKGRAAFNATLQIAKQNEGLGGIKYPEKYRKNIILTIISIIMMFVYIFITYIALENIELLPKLFQNESVIFVMFGILEITNIILSFIFALRVKKIREVTISECREKQRKKS